jgi:hypothetical protein
MGGDPILRSVFDSNEQTSGNGSYCGESHQVFSNGHSFQQLLVQSAANDFCDTESIFFISESPHASACWRPGGGGRGGEAEDLLAASCWSKLQKHILRWNFNRGRMKISKKLPFSNQNLK